MSPVIILALILGAGYWIYNNVKVSTVTICISPEQTQTNITCVNQIDCTNYLTSVYGSYQNTPMQQFILNQITTCNIGRCELNKYEYKSICNQGDVPIVYKITVKEWMTKAWTATR